MTLRTVCVAAALGAALLRAALAAEVTVLSAGAVEPGIRPALLAFERSSGHRVALSFATGPQIRERIEGGAAVDVVIAPAPVLDALEARAKVDADRAGRVPVGRVGIGVAVRPGVPHPDIATAEAFKRALLDADALAYNRATTGLYFETVLKRLGIDAQVQPKVTRHADGAAVMEHLLQGRGREIGIGATTEIVLFESRGLQLVGPLPAELQNFTTYVAAQTSAASHADAALALLRHLASPATQAGFVAAGIEAAPR